MKILLSYLSLWSIATHSLVAFVPFKLTSTTWFWDHQCCCFDMYFCAFMVGILCTIHENTSSTARYFRPFILMWLEAVSWRFTSDDLFFTTQSFSLVFNPQDLLFGLMLVITLWTVYRLWFMHSRCWVVGLHLYLLVDLVQQAQAIRHTLNRIQNNTNFDWRICR